MMKYSTLHAMKNNYFGLKDGQFLGICKDRNEIYIFHIFSDGSNAVMVQDSETKKHICQFGSLNYCKNVMKNNEYRQLTDDFINALKLA